MNNAGTSAYKSSLEVTEEELSSVMSTNFEAAFHFSQLAHPLMKASGNGSIVFMSSVAGLMSLPYSTPYAASKGKSQFFHLDTYAASKYGHLSAFTFVLSLSVFKTCLWMKLLHPYKECFRSSLQPR